MPPTSASRLAPSRPVPANASSADEGRLVRVPGLVVGGELLGRDLRRQREHRVERLAGVFGEPLALGEQLDVEPLVQQELQVASRQQQRGHVDPQVGR
jgi:hypothetical protein